jgi:hypothetical protein
VRVGDQKTGKWGYIDSTGRMIVNPQFDAADLMIDGIAAVRVGDESTGKGATLIRAGNTLSAPNSVLRRTSQMASQQFGWAIARPGSGDISTKAEES